MANEYDAQTSERITALAKSLKDLHLAATMEEAFTRAKEIILGSTKEQATDFKMKETIGELMKDDIAQKKKQEEIKQAIGELEVYEKENEAEKKEIEAELEDVDKKLSAGEHEIGEMEDIVEEAEKVENSKEK